MEIRIEFFETEYIGGKTEKFIIVCNKFKRCFVAEKLKELKTFNNPLYCLVGYSLDMKKVTMGRKTYCRYTSYTKKFLFSDNKIEMVHNIKHTRNI